MSGIDTISITHDPEVTKEQENVTYRSALRVSSDSDEPVQSPFKLGNSKLCSVSSITLIANSSHKKRLRSDCAYAQAHLSLCWSYISHCWKSHVAAHFKGATMHVAVGVWLKTLSRRDVTLLEL